MKRKPLTIGLLIFLFTIVTTYLSSLLFNDVRQSIIAGLLVGVLATLFEIRLAIESSSEKTVKSAKELSERLLESLNIQQTYTANEWLREILKRIVDLKQVAEQQIHDLARFQGIITQALDKARREVGTSFRIDTGDDELERIMRLKDIVANAKEYIYAVTFDVDDYLNKFWAKVFGSEYVKSNLEAARRGVEIERIFVVEKKIISGKQLNDIDKEKHDKLMSLVKALKRVKKI